MLYRPTVLQETIKLGVTSSLDTDTIIIVLKILRKGVRRGTRSERREVEGEEGKDVRNTKAVAPY